MAVFGMSIVIIFALLSAFAPILPLYPYDEIILDHQNLPPTLTKSAGDLMKYDKMKNLFLLHGKMVD